jgi:hypothetical protein
MHRTLLAAVLCLAPFAALATDTGTPKSAETVTLDADGFTYELFEYTVEHADLATCPEGFDPDEMFCRLTLAADMMHVFVFSLDGDQPLVAVKSHEVYEGLPQL